MLLVVNILMQGSFAFYLMDGLTEKPITHNDIDELRWWRRNVAHSLEYYSEAKGESLARRVCDNDFGIEASGVQAGLHATLNEYLGDYFKRSEKDYFGVGPGEYVAMLAVCLWVISVFLDARAALDTLAALQSLPRAWKSEIRLNGDAEVEVARISHARFAACVLVQLCVEIKFPAPHAIDATLHTGAAGPPRHRRDPALVRVAIPRVHDRHQRAHIECGGVGVRLVHRRHNLRLLRADADASADQVGEAPARARGLQNRGRSRLPVGGKFPRLPRLRARRVFHRISANET